MQHHSFYNISRINGRKEATEFFEDFCDSFIKNSKRYFDKFPRASKEHCFTYGSEQVIKTYVTVALNEITRSYFIQECPVDRKKFLGKKRETGSGRLDYWAHREKTSYFIEVKDAWIRYHGQSADFKFYESISTHLKKAQGQIKSVENRGQYLMSKRLFGLGLVIAPIFYRVPLGKEKPIFRLTADIREKLNESSKNIGFNMTRFWKIPDEYHEEEQCYRNHVENTIGLAILGWVKPIR